MAEVAYRSEVRVERVKGPLRRAYLPVDPQPVLFSTHGPVAAHYKAVPGQFEPHATTVPSALSARLSLEPAATATTFERSGGTFVSP